MADIMELFGKKKVEPVAKKAPPKPTPEQELASKKNAMGAAIGEEGLAGSAVKAMKDRRKMLDDI